MKTMVTISLNLPPEDLTRLRQIQDEVGVTVSEQIRRAIKAALESRQQESKKKK
jgi:predicted DNA-binding protein